MDNKELRTLLAFLLAPALASIIVGLLHVGYGFDGMFTMSLSASFAFYPVSWIVGIIEHFILRKLKRLTIMHYCLAGIIAIAPLSLMPVNGQTSTDFLISVILSSTMGALVAALYMIIRRPTESIQSR